MTVIFNFFPDTIAEFFGIVALLLHLTGYAIYGWSVFHEWGRPHVLTWFMWLGGGIIEYATYQAIPGAHWANNALPLACVIGLGFITLAIIGAKAKSWFKGIEYAYEPPEKKDYLLFGFDAGSGSLWWTNIWSAAFANFVAVGTSIFTFIPLWRTVYKNPKSEHYLSWLIWTAAYMAMFMTVLTGNESQLWELYMYPVLYFLLHAVVVILSLRTSK